jgi:2-deoxy-D-gluconate 3-dehydrogenase
LRAVPAGLYPYPCSRCSRALCNLCRAHPRRTPQPSSTIQIGFNPERTLPLRLDKFNLTGKNALVTGSSRGIGAGIALALAEAGANIALHGSSSVPQATQQSIDGMGVRHIALVGDVGDSATCQRLVDETVNGLGSIDILINNAGIIRRAPAAEYSSEDWEAVINVNLSSVFRLTQYAGRHMLAQGSGKIVNIASLLTFQGGINVPAYAAAKGGVGQLTKAFANEWAPKHVNVNAIAPGYFATDNTEALQNNPERAQQILDRIPAGRWGDPEDLGGAAVFLSSAASNYVNGHILVVDGGWLNR